MKNPFRRAYLRAWTILRPIFMIFHPIEVKGRENLPEEPVLMCANHSSAWDPILVMMALWGEYPLRIMAKKQLLHIPIIGGFLRSLGVFGVDRGNSDIGAVKTAIKSLREGFSLLLFPEGTRVRRRGQVTPKGGAAMMAIRSGVKMLPVFVGTSKKLFQKIPVIFGKPYAPSYTGRNGTAEEYQRNTDEIMRRSYELGGVQ